MCPSVMHGTCWQAGKLGGPAACYTGRQKDRLAEQCGTLWHVPLFCSLWEKQASVSGKFVKAAGLRHSKLGATCYVQGGWQAEAATIYSLRKVRDQELPTCRRSGREVVGACANV